MYMHAHTYTLLLQLYQLDTGGHTRQAQFVQGTNPRSLIKTNNLMNKTGQ